MNVAKQFLVILGISTSVWLLVGVWQVWSMWEGVSHALATGDIQGTNLTETVSVSVEASISMVGITGSLLIVLGSLIFSNLFRGYTTIVRWWRVYLLGGITLVVLSFFGSDLFIPIVVGDQGVSVGLGSSLVANVIGWSATVVNYFIAITVYILGIAVLYPRNTVRGIMNMWHWQNQVITSSLKFIGMLGLQITRYTARNTVQPDMARDEKRTSTYAAGVAISPGNHGNESKQEVSRNHTDSAKGDLYDSIEDLPQPEATPGSRSLPPASILNSNDGDPRNTDIMLERAQLEASEIEKSLLQHGIEVIVRDIKPGPTVTVYGLEPGWAGSRGTVAPEKRRRVTVDAILAREKDLALALAVPSLRFEAPVPGASLVGIEVPNPTPSTVLLGGILQRDELTAEKEKGSLPVVLGKSASGDRELADLALMPHLLTAGATGSGKSMFVNSLLISLLMQFSPEELRLLLIDPKRVELTQYNGIPHLAARVVVDPAEAVIALRGAVEEMMHRLKLLEETGSRNINSYNGKMDSQTDKLAKLVIVVDEMADLMMLAPNDIEHALCRLAQLGRATGIHLIVATQRPSVDVITGLIKANFPSRISFAVASQTDSRTILDGPGADKLLGNGDMLFLSQDLPKPKRVQGTFVSDLEIEALVEYWKKSGFANKPLIDLDVSSGEQTEGWSLDGRDSLFEEAVALSEMHTKVSTSLLQRRLRIGYPRAARLRDELEKAGVLSRVGDVQPVEERIED